jgi:ATP-dependent exoDNAse (exonuclease V) beta subunit
LRVGVIDWLGSDGDQAGVLEGDPGDATAGMLVHRLVESRGLAVTADNEAELTYARGLLRPEERASLLDIDATVRTAVASWRGLQNQPEIRRLLGTGRRYHEVPFSLRMESNGAPVVLRGSIDCLIRQENNAIVVLEFKTGQRRPVHQRQLDVYVEAARQTFPEAVVEGRLVYSDCPSLSPSDTSVP